MGRRHFWSVSWAARMLTGCKETYGVELEAGWVGAAGVELGVGLGWRLDGMAVTGQTWTDR